MEEALRYSMDEPGSWFEYPAALLWRDEIVGWVCDREQAEMIVNLYELRGDRVGQTQRLLAGLEASGLPPAESGVRFDTEATWPLLPGFPLALKWDGEVIAWLRDERLAQPLATVLNAFVQAYLAATGGLPVIEARPRQQHRRRSRVA